MEKKIEKDVAKTKNPSKKVEIKDNEAPKEEVKKEVELPKKEATKKIIISELSILELINFKDACNELSNFYKNEYEITRLYSTQKDKELNEAAKKKFQEYNQKYFSIINELENRVSML